MLAKMLPFLPLPLFKKKRHFRAGVNQAAVFRYKVGYRRNGVDHITHDWQDNLILDSGLNKLGTTILWNNAWSFCLFGNPVSPTPVRRDSLTTTFTTVGTACTASVGFFTSADVGRLIKFNDATFQECYIGAFISATAVTLLTAPSPVITATSATIWYVNETALDTFYASTNTYGTNGGDNGTSAAGNITTYKRTFVGTAIAGAPVTLTEIGFSNSASNSNIFDRDIIAGGVTLQIGDQPLAIAQLILTLTPNTSTAAGNVATGFNSAGNMILCGTQAAGATVIPQVNSSGVTVNSSGTMEPANGMQVSLVTATFTLPAFSNGIGTLITPQTAPDSFLNGTYSAGNFFRDATSTWGVASGNGSIFGIQAQNTCWVQLFTSSFVKASTQTLTFTMRLSWQRALVN